MASEPIRDPVNDRLLTPQNSAFIIIDYQPVQVNSIASMDRQLLINNIAGAANAAVAYGLPIVHSTVNVKTGLNKPPIPQVQKALKDIPKGSFLNPIKMRNFKPAKGEAYGRIEAPKGELGFHLISDGGPTPYRYRVRPPSFINLTILEDMCLGQKVADCIIILGSVDIVLGEVDR